jgi:ribosomal protein S18 acetylase RimI-like enzyme
LPYRKAAIRPYRPEDRPVLFGLARMSLGSNSRWSDERTLSVLDGDTIFVAEVDGSPAGFVAVEEGAKTLRIDELFVVPEHEDESVEWQLLEYAEGYAIANDSHRIEAVVEGDEPTAHAPFRRYGFAPAESEGLLQLTLPQQ